MPTPVTTKYDINYQIGWAIVTDAFWLNTGQEVKLSSIRDKIRETVLADGYDVRVVNQTDELEDWERRRTRKPFDRPRGMYIFRLVNKPGTEKRVGEMEMSQWPQR